jgi:DNA excision repair protein ERCC-3
MFSGNRAKSGIIVLPCGAGKTLVGIMALEKIRMKTLIVCINNLTVKQWYRQLEMFVATDMSRVFKFSSDETGKKVPDMTEPCIVISTYSMISMNDQLR